MTYVVNWTGAAIQELARLEAAATDLASFRQSTAWIDYTLRRIPSDVGESRAGKARVWFTDVVGIFYAINDIAMTVKVVHVVPARRTR